MTNLLLHDKVSVWCTYAIVQGLTAVCQPVRPAEPCRYFGWHAVCLVRRVTIEIKKQKYIDYEL